MCASELILERSKPSIPVGIDRRLLGIWATYVQVVYIMKCVSTIDIVMLKQSIWQR
jgi:hypothetical protein